MYESPGTRYGLPGWVCRSHVSPLSVRAGTGRALPLASRAAPVMTAPALGADHLERTEARGYLAMYAADEQTSRPPDSSLGLP